MVQQQYPFWSDGAGANTIMDPLTKVAITTLPFRGKSTKQRLMGISSSCTNQVFLNNIRVLIGNSLPAYRYLEVNPNPIQSDEFTNGLGTNYEDLGGLEIQEGDTITITGVVGTGQAGVLHVDDLEGEDPPIPQGNYVMLKCGGTNDGGAAVAVTGGDLDARKLENTRMYSLFKSDVLPEGSAELAIEMVIVQCGARTVSLPVGRMVWNKVPFSFSGLEWNNGQVLVYVQVNAAEKVDVRLHLIESQLQGASATPNAPPISGIKPSTTPGVTSIPVGGNFGLRPPTGGGLFQRRQ